MIDHFTIHESIWDTEHKDSPKLWDGEKACVWGFFGRALGLSREQMLNKAFLADCFDGYNPDLKFLWDEIKWGKGIFTVETLVFYLNDNPKITQEKRINSLKFVFDKYNITFNVV